MNYSPIIPTWPLSKKLLIAILNDRVTDRFVAELVWERLRYEPEDKNDGVWKASEETPSEWLSRFPEAPKIISERSASVYLTRSIPKEFKQLLKIKLGFSGYRINELFPRRTRRATAVSWLLAWLAENNYELKESEKMPLLVEKPIDPLKGH